VYGWWREATTIYAWHGPKLMQISSDTFKRSGAAPTSDTGFGPGCIKGVR
jgi:hypothetical protein